MFKSLKFIFVLFLYNNCFGQAKFDIIITEIFADPTPSHGLPDKEYLELYNKSGKPINLKGYTLFYNTSDVNFPSAIIEPNEYLIVCRENNSSFFEAYGKVIGLSNFSLLNGGTKLRLTDAKGNLSHEVNYSDEWYTVGRDQGYSLEMIDINYPCKDLGNWTSTASDIGGTPGKKNASAASNPDVEPPSFVSYDELSPTKYVFIFSEKLSSDATILQIKSDALQIEGKYLDSLNENSIIINFTKTPAKDQLYNIIFNAISDCSGNVGDPIEVSIGNIPQPKIGEVLLSEVLFNPKANGVDFVEIYNNSSNLINLRGFGLSRLNTMNELEEPKVLFTNNRILEPNDFLVVTENKQIQTEIYPKSIDSKIIQVKDIPSYNNDKGSVVLINAAKEIVDQFDYNETMHHPSLDDVDGISLEKKNFDLDNSPANWQSSSSSEGYATPGYKIWTNSLIDEFKVTVNPSIITPDNDGIDEECRIEFLVPESGNITSKIFDINGVQILELANNLYIPNQLFLNWNGLDTHNQPINTGYYILFSEFRTPTNIYQDKQKILVSKR